MRAFSRQGPNLWWLWLSFAFIKDWRVVISDHYLKWSLLPLWRLPSPPWEVAVASVLPSVFSSITMLILELAFFDRFQTTQKTIESTSYRLCQKSSRNIPAIILLFYGSFFFVLLVPPLPNWVVDKRERDIALGAWWLLWGPAESFHAGKAGNGPAHNKKDDKRVCLV